MSLGFLCSSGTIGFPVAAASLWKSSPATASRALQELCYPLEFSSVLLSMLRIQIIQSAFALPVHRGMGWCNGCLLYLDIFYSFSGSYTPNIEWFSDLPGISIAAERFFQNSETVNYQATNIFASNKYHLEREDKNLEDYFNLLVNTPVQWKKIRNLRRKACEWYSTNLFH